MDENSKEYVKNVNTYAISRSVSIPMALYESVNKYGFSLSKCLKNGIALELEKKDFIGVKLTAYENLILLDSDVQQLKRRIITMIQRPQEVAENGILE